MRKPDACLMLVGEDGQPRGMVEGMRSGSVHKTPHGEMRVVWYVPAAPPRRSRRRKS